MMEGLYSNNTLFASLMELTKFACRFLFFKMLLSKKQTSVSSSTINAFNFSSMTVFIIRLKNGTSSFINNYVTKLLWHENIYNKKRLFVTSFNPKNGKEVIKTASNIRI